MKWAYGVTTVPERLDALLPQTLHSLALAGFGEPRLFVDGAETDVDYRHFDLPITTRFPHVHAYPHWVLSAWELYLRSPEADRYAIFQDDLLAVRHLRQYLERTPYPANGYLNLYTFQESNETLVRDKPPGWYEASTLDKSEQWQTGRGAVGLVFDRAAMIALLDSGYLARRFHDYQGRDKGGTKNGLPRAYSRIDGAVVTAMNLNEWREYIHAPSLIQHTGKRSSLGSAKMPTAKTFPGETFDATEWIND